MIKTIIFISGLLINTTVLAASPPVSKNGTKKTTMCRCVPSSSCWPKSDQWAAFSSQLEGSLVKPASPVAECKKNAESDACRTALKNLKNPFYMQAKPGRSESRGWTGAWQAQQSAYAVEVKSTKDVVTAVNFARNHNLRLVIKGAGHDYLGRSSAPDSLLIWTHKMRHVEYDSSFVPAGCAKDTNGVPALSVGAGTRWIEAYTAATTKHNMYVQGGGCTTVGVAGGFTQGGGFGSFSKQFGTGAAGVLQVEVVTADGKVLTANQCQNEQLFWAIRGGGAGTYGVVTNMTLRAHKLPKNFGVMQGTITAKTDDDYKKLVKHFLTFYIKYLNNAHWGEQFSFKPNNTISILMVTQNFDKQQALATWQPLKEWIQQSKGRYSIASDYISIPPQKMWDLNFWEKNHPDMVVRDMRQNARPGEYWWAGNGGEVYSYWHTYQSWWLPDRLFSQSNIQDTAETIYKASRLSPVAFHINKGLSGGSPLALNTSRQTSMNPTMLNAAALVIMSSASNNMDHDWKNPPPMTKTIKTKVANITKAMDMIRALAPDSGTYVNEADYFQKNWQQVFWGSNYQKLLTLKHRYDPDGLFYCHHCVGSEMWTDDGFCRIRDVP